MKKDKDIETIVGQLQEALKQKKESLAVVQLLNNYIDTTIDDIVARGGVSALFDSRGGVRTTFLSQYALSRLVLMKYWNDIDSSVRDGLNGRYDQFDRYVSTTAAASVG